MMVRSLKDAESVIRLAKKLDRCEFVTRYNSPGESEAGRLAHSMSDLEESFERITKTYIPILCQTEREEDIEEALLDIGEELRHILYHIKDPRFFRYLIEKK